MLFIYFLLVTPYSLCVPVCLAPCFVSSHFFSLPALSSHAKPLRYSVCFCFSFSAAFLPRISSGLLYEASLTPEFSHPHLTRCAGSVLFDPMASLHFLSSWIQVSPFDATCPTECERKWCLPLPGRNFQQWARASLCFSLPWQPSRWQSLCEHPRMRTKWERGLCQWEMST